ncbi:hypothetical protein CPX_001559 [Candidatus Phytoplasma pruni]|uniref:Uncharacterized protein n=1 Tax=Candidatus Phytoplasma pruni TaxID=479893 RepID=A0A0M1MZW3_9MOLU|nr:hypothetical protein [Candidatus Phytoplasma pruni]KOR75436.1 hypothetical protein CPX_001559 [Candidatus Phytoplasma pruni]
MSSSLVDNVVNFANFLIDVLDIPDFDDLVEKLISMGEFSVEELKEMGIDE